MHKYCPAADISVWLFYLTYNISDDIVMILLINAILYYAHINTPYSVSHMTFI